MTFSILEPGQLRYVAHVRAWNLGSADAIPTPSKLRRKAACFGSQDSSNPEHVQWKPESLNMSVLYPQTKERRNRERKIILRPCSICFESTVTVFVFWGRDRQHAYIQSSSG